MYRGQTLQNLKLKIFLQKNSRTRHTPPQIIKILIDIARSSDEVRSKETAQG